MITRRLGKISKLTIGIVVFVLIGIFVIGYLVCWNNFQKLLSEEQFQLCEQVAQKVYKNGETKVIFETQEEILITITKSNITVQLLDGEYRGKVVVELQNGKFTMTRDLQTEKAIVISILMGLLFSAASTILPIMIYLIRKNNGKIQGR